MGTMFTSVYSRFFGKITDDMYLELTQQDTERDVRELLINALPGFEFPRKALDYIVELKDDGTDISYFLADLNSEEINILAILMMNEWLQRQVTSIENIRMKYSGVDFKMTSQANHLAKLLTLQAETQRQSIHMQRLYKRRKISNSKYVSNWSVFRENSVLHGHQDIPESEDEENIERYYDGQNIDETTEPDIIYDGGEL